MNRDDALQKIKKCMAMGRSANPNEAAAAMRQAQKLMELHGISEQDVALADVSEVPCRTAMQSGPRWEVRLANMVGDAFGCDVIWSAERRLIGHRFSRRSLVLFIGVGAAPQVASYAWSVLDRQCAAQRLAHIQQQPKSCKPITRTARGDAFADGWVTGVRDKLHTFAGEKHPAAAGTVQDAASPQRDKRDREEPRSWPQREGQQRHFRLRRRETCAARTRNRGAGAGTAVMSGEKLNPVAWETQHGNILPSAAANLTEGLAFGWHPLDRRALGAAMVRAPHGEPGSGKFATPSEPARESGSVGCDSAGRQIDVRGAPGVSPATEWREAERICDLPDVAEAIGNLLEDQTGDNATCLVRAVLQAAYGVTDLAQPGQHMHADARLERAQRSVDAKFNSAADGVSESTGDDVLQEVLKWALAGHISDHGITSEAGAAIRAAALCVPAAARARPLPGLQTLANVIGCLRAEARYVDEEGEATGRLEDLLQALRADGVMVGAAPDLHQLADKALLAARRDQRDFTDESRETASAARVALLSALGVQASDAPQRGDWRTWDVSKATAAPDGVSASGHQTK